MKKYLTILFVIFHLSAFSQIELLRYDAIRLCDSVDVVQSKIRTNLHSTSIYKDSLKLNVRLYQNCGLNSKQGAIHFQNDTLVLMWTENNSPIEKDGVIYEKGTWFHKDSLRKRSGTTCSCYMELTYVIKGLEKIAPLKINNRIVFQRDSMYKIFTPTFRMFEGDTINYMDSIGVKTGKWVEFDSLERVTKIEHIVTENFSSEFESFEYHGNGEIAIHNFERRAINGCMMEEKYDSTGVLRERYFASDLYFKDSDDYFQVRYIEFFDEKGELIKRDLLDVRNNLYEYGYFYE